MSPVDNFKLATRLHAECMSGLSIFLAQPTHTQRDVSVETTQERTQMTNENNNNPPLSMIVLTMEPEFGERVIAHALEFRNLALEGSASAFNSAIADSIRIDGFRDASKAQAVQLRDPVTYEMIRGNDRIAAGVLRVWTESHPDLREAVTDYLKERNYPTDGPNYRRRCFTSEWSRDEWIGLRDAVTAANPDFDDDDVGLMLCCVSGNIPDLPHDRAEREEIESPLLMSWLDELKDLPPDAPDWRDIEEFIEAIEAISTAKQSELASTIRVALGDLRSETLERFGDELSYLGVDLADVPAGEFNSVYYVSLKGVLDEIRAELGKYQPIFPKGQSRDEEMERAAARGEIEEAILKIAREWEDLVAEPFGFEDDSSQVDVAQGDEPRVSEQTAKANDASSRSAEEHPTPEAVSASEIVVPVQRYTDLQSEHSRLAHEVARLEIENASLKVDKEELVRYGDELKLTNSRLTETEEYWRQQYVEASTRRVREEESEPALPLSVREAVEMAEASFRAELAFALNSKSERGSRFQKPEEVLNTLGWLATTYHRLRSMPGQAPNFDKLLKESCPGWSYKPKQTEVTKEQFKEWYTTTLDGKTYELNSHIGKGNSFDQQRTIRIAFDWDEERRQVVVGYIGRHQRNRRS